MNGHYTKSNVFVLDDFRDNLIVDRYDPIFFNMAGKKINQLRSQNSEDAVTWNAFRSLGKIDPAFWFPKMFSRAFPGRALPQRSEGAILKLWEKFSAPPGLRLHQQDEGESEVDVMLESEYSVWFIEAKYRGDIQLGTTNNPARDQVIRNIDVGSWFAGVRDFYFSLLVLSNKRSPIGASHIETYRESSTVAHYLCSHRPDSLPNLKGVGLLTWQDIASVLSDCAGKAPRPDERPFAAAALAWLKTKGVEPLS